MQRKLVGLGLGSLGGIFGLNYAFKGEADELFPEPISNEEAEHISVLQANDESEDIKKLEPVVKPTKTKEQQEAERKVKEEQKRKAEESKKWWRGKEAEELNGVKTGALRKFLMHLYKDDPSVLRRMKWFHRNRLDWFIKKDMEGTNYSFRGPSIKVHWDKLKELIENGGFNKDFIHQ